MTRRRRPMRSARAQALVIVLGVTAAILTAGIAFAMIAGVIPPIAAVIAAAALAAWLFAIIRMLDIAASSEPMSLDCLDGVHRGCPICSCPCHRKA